MTTISPPRMTAWAALAASLAALTYAANYASSDGPPEDALFQWGTAVTSAILYAIILAVVLAIARPVDRATLGLRAPVSWRGAGWLVAAGFLAIFAVGAILSAAGLDAGDEQGLIPKEWDASRAAPFAANFVVVAVLAPIVEETMFRGLGFAIVRQVAGNAAAVVVTAVLFGLAHGLLVALPVLVAFGVVLATVRWRTQSIYPPMILHATFNALALTLGVTGVGT